MGTSALTFTVDDLRNEAGKSTFSRSKSLIPHVSDLERSEHAAKAIVTGTSPYSVQLIWHPILHGICTCPHYKGGNFCKHITALGLTLLGVEAPKPRRRASQQEKILEEVREVEEFVQGVEAPKLRSLITLLCQNDPLALMFFQAQMAQSGQQPEGLVDELESRCTSLLSARGFIDYYRSMELGSEIDDFLGELRGLLCDGLPDVVAPLALKITTRLRKMLETRVDDSSGFMGGACQNALDLYAEACCAGTVDEKKLGKWLAKFKIETPGWPEATLEQFLPALGVEGLKVYRRAVEKELAKIPVGNEEDWEYFTLRDLDLELADADGDIDQAITILLRGKRPRYAAIVQRLESAGREREAMAYVEKAISVGSVSVRPVFEYCGVKNEYELDATMVASMFIRDGRYEDALDFAKRFFTSSPSYFTYSVWMDTARKCGVYEDAHETAWMLIDSHPWPNGDVPIEIALEEGDVERAWTSARYWGTWFFADRLVDMYPQPFPLDAMEIYGELAHKPLNNTGRAAAEDCVAVLKRAYRSARLWDAIEQETKESRATPCLDKLFEIVDGIRDQYRNRPALMEVLRLEGF